MQNNEIPLYVTDTHSLIWYLTDSPKLSLNASKGFGNGDTSHIYWQRAERIAKNAHGS
jgi:PIN domain nuclease of toxin-antitoxin system